MNIDGRGWETPSGRKVGFSTPSRAEFHNSALNLFKGQKFDEQCGRGWETPSGKKQLFLEMLYTFSISDSIQPLR